MWFSGFRASVPVTLGSACEGMVIGTRNQAEWLHLIAVLGNDSVCYKTYRNRLILGKSVSWIRFWLLPSSGLQRVLPNSPGGPFIHNTCRRDQEPEERFLAKDLWSLFLSIIKPHWELGLFSCLGRGGTSWVRGIEWLKCQGPRKNLCLKSLLILCELTWTEHHVFTV